MNIDELVQQAHRTSIAKGWWIDEEPNIGEKLMLIVTEVAEAMEETRTAATINGVPLLNNTYIREGKPEGFPIELADVVIRVADLCGHLNIDLTKALEVKLAYNKTRPFRHGGKTA